MSRHKHYKNIIQKIREVRTNSQGFTLIELLVVVSIIAVLASVVMSSLQSSRLKAYDAQIKSDMTQIKSALELYANDNAYLYPKITTLAKVQTSSTYAIDVTPKEINSFDIASIFSAKRVEAAGRNQDCVYFDNLASVLIPKYIGSIPKHPLDDGGDVCYKYFSSDSGDMAVAYGPLITETYSSGINKQVGIAVGKTDIADLSAICTANVNSGAVVNSSGTSNSPFPLFDGTGGDHCQGNITDTVIGVTSGGGDISTQSVTARCSDPQYTNQATCEVEHSYCSDPQYTDESSCTSNWTASGGTCSDPQYNGQHDSCVNNGYYSGGYCSNSSYSDETSCTQNGYYSGGGCTNASYTDEYSCVNAGYTSGGGCSNSSYYDSQSCTGAGYCSSGGYTDEASCISVGYCSNGSYTDQNSCQSGGGGYCSQGGYSDPSSCTGAGYCSSGGYSDQTSCESAGYCGGGSYSDQTSCQNAGYCPDGMSGDPDTCSSNGYSWTPYGYQWYPYQWMNYGYYWVANYNSWTPNTWTPYGYSWSNGDTFSYGYTWSQGTWTGNTWYQGTSWTPNTWTDGQSTQNTWTYVPAGTWGVF